LFHWTLDKFGKDECKERCPTSPVELTYLVKRNLDELWRSWLPFFGGCGAFIGQEQ
jgi:hypothetical protein